LFKVYDIDGDGLISKEELFVILKSLVTNTTNTQLEQIVEKTMEDLQTTHDGMLDFEDFKRIFAEGKV
jgi:Ca2+-binding EF-hand superfamily protein